METAVFILVSVAVQWIILMIVLPIAQKLADFALPALPETAWKVAVVSLATVLVALLPLGGLLTWILKGIVFWVLMVKWFDVDFFGAIVIVAISFIVQLFLGGMIIGCIATIL